MKNPVLNNSAILLFAFLMASVAFCAVTSRDYKASNRQVIMAVTGADDITYEGLYHLYHETGLEDFLLVDLRSADAFAASHIEGAINVPLDELLDRRHRRSLRSKKVILLYAEEEHLAVAARMLLLGQGKEGVQVIPGDYATIRSFLTSDFDPRRAHYSADKARWDHQRFMPISRESQVEKPEVIRVEEQHSDLIIGGC